MASAFKPLGTPESLTRKKEGDLQRRITPRVLDMPTLTKSTVAALELLVPVCKLVQEARFNILVPSEIKAVTSQADIYREAIQSSIAASQKGHTIATEVIGILSVPGVTQSECESYLKGTYKLAAEGCKLAQDCAQDFKDVRSTVYKLIEKAQKRKWGLASAFQIMGPVLTLQERVDILEKLCESLKDYAEWWKNMEIDHTSLEDRSKMDFHPIRSKSVFDKWIIFQNDYAEYILQIQDVQGKHPELFPHSR